MARPFRLLLAGDWAASAREWVARGCPWTQAEALSYGDPDAVANALRVFDGLGAGVYVPGSEQGAMYRAERWISRIHFGNSEDTFFVRIDLRRHLVAAWPFVLIGLGGQLATRIDVYTVTAFGQGELVGRYQVIAAVFTQFQLVPGLLARPFGTGMLRMDRAALLRISARSVRWGLLLLLPLALLAGLGLYFVYGAVRPTWSAGE